jgi:hypothetical protein
VNVYGAQESIPQAYVAWRVGTKKRVVLPVRQAGSRFLGSLKGLQILTLAAGPLVFYFRVSSSLHRRQSRKS